MTKTPSPTSTTTTTTKTSRCRPGVRSMTGARYLDRRRDRVQNDGGGGFSVPAAVPLPAAGPGEDPPERGRLTVVGHRFAPAGLGAAGGGGAGVSRGGGDWRNA